MGGGIAEAVIQSHNYSVLYIPECTMYKQMNKQTYKQTNKHTNTHFIITMYIVRVPWLLQLTPLAINNYYITYTLLYPTQK